MAEADAGLRVPPHNLEAEEAALGAILIDEGAASRAQEVLLPDHFYRRQHAIIYEQMLELARRNEPIDLIAVTDRLRAAGILDKAGGAAALTALASKVPSAANFETYARLVYEKAMYRRLIGAGTKIVEAGFEQPDLDEAFNRAEQEVYAVTQHQRSRDFVPMSELVKRAFDHIEKLSARGGAVTGTPSGFRDLDLMTSGFQPSDLVILAARPSMGKTAFALNIADHVAVKAGMTVALFSLEMSVMQLTMRLVCSRARVSSHDVRQGRIRNTDWAKIALACGELSKSPIFIDDTPGIGFSELRSKARKLHAEKGLGLVMIDYLQLMSGGARPAESRQQEVSEISRSLKALARELSVPVVALSQLSRAVENRTDKRPVLADLRESGAIEQDADVVMFIYRDEYYRRELSEEKGVAEIIIAKQRNGPVGIAKLAFLEEETRFADLSTYQV